MIRYAHGLDPGFRRDDVNQVGTNMYLRERHVPNVHPSIKHRLFSRKVKNSQRKSLCMH
jgi:hypothetical protein